MPVPYVFANQTGPIPLSQLDANFATQASASEIDYTITGGTVSRTLQAKLFDVISAGDFGAVGDGVTNNTTALQNAINYVAFIGGGTLYIPNGSYVTGPLTLLANVSIVGSGKWSCSFIPSTANEVVFSLVETANTVVSTVYSDFSINCQSVTGVQGFQMTLCMHVAMRNLAFIGCSQNFVIDRGWFYDIDGCESQGNTSLKAGSCKIWSSVDTDYVYQVGLRRYSIRNNGAGVQGPVVYVRRGVAVQLFQVNCNDANVGGAQTFLQFENDCQGCKAVECGSGAQNYGVLVQTGSGVNVSPTFLEIIGCDFDQSNDNAIYLNGCSWVKVMAGNITTSSVGTTSAGILVQGASTNILLHSIVIDGYNGTNGAAVYMNGTGGTGYVELRDNHIDTCYFGLVLANSPTNVTGFGNVFKNCTNKLNGSPAGTSSYFANNYGFNPIAVSTPTFPTSGTNVTNTTGFPVRIFIVGGTFTAVNVNGSSVGNGNVDFYTQLNPGETIAVTYSSAPTWTWVGL